MPPKQREVHVADAVGLELMLGADTALRLTERYGGTRLAVPKTASARGTLAREVGLPAARTLSASYGGTVIKVPLAKPWRAAQLRRQGLTYAQIARRLCASESSVSAWLRAAGMTRASIDRVRASTRHHSGDREPC